jgi:predicted RNA-binding protein YlxR (DUF448 family)
MPGRGAHLHPDRSCLDLAERRRAFPRALRLPGPLDATLVQAHVEQPVEHDQQSTVSRQRREAGPPMSAR